MADHDKPTPPDSGTDTEGHFMSDRNLKGEPAEVAWEQLPAAGGNEKTATSQDDE